MPRLCGRGFLGSLAVAAWPAVTQAQSAYPSEPIRIVHGCGPGSNPDVIARVISPSLMSMLGQSSIVELKPGAGERIAAQYAMNQSADGFTLHLITGRANVISATDRQVSFSTPKDFSYISTITLFPFALFVGERSRPYRRGASRGPGSLARCKQRCTREHPRSVPCPRRVRLRQMEAAFQDRLPLTGIESRGEETWQA